MKKRVAIVGFGNRARHYYNELRRSEHFELAAIFDGVQNNEIYGRIPFYDNINDQAPGASGSITAGGASGDPGS